MYTPISAPLPMNIISMRLMHHWTTVLSSSLATAPVNIPLLQHHFPQLAFDRPFLLHSMLALSAFHLSLVYPESRENALSATLHRQSALSLLTSLSIGGFDQSVLGIAFLTTTTMTNGFNSPQHHNLIAMLTTIHNIFHGKNYFIFCDQTFLGLNFTSFLSQLQGDVGAPNNLFPAHLLQIHLPDSEIFPEPEELANPRVSDAYRSAVVTLRTAWLFVSLGFESFGAVSWPENFSDKFCALLNEKRPRALVLLYHYCAMLAGTSPACWWARRSGQHMDWIRGVLDEQWRACLHMETAGALVELVE
uniref:Uncharacterized protein n=2 Tax=Moniliophthora roreri TaxID=221103 RepID=A0A0W0F6M5_MONRR